MANHNPMLPALDPVDLVNEMADVDLGDKRLDNRLLALMGQLAASPSSSFSAQTGSEAELEGLYRFMRNPRVDWRDVLEPHLEMTTERVAKAGEALIVHDTTTCRVADDAELESYISTGKRGFLAHVSLALDGRESKKPLGVVATEVLFRSKTQNRTKKKNGRRMGGSDTARLKDKEYDRWWRGIEEAENRLALARLLIHVMDREGDSYPLLARLLAGNRLFVVRWYLDRRTKLPEDTSEQWRKASELLAEAQDTGLRREVQVGKRKAKTAPRYQRAKGHQPRDRRTATLHVAKTTLVFKKPHCYPKALGYPETLTINAVRVYEPNPPADAEAIDWVLLTNLPIAGADDVTRVVDIYCQRWTVEEFFKALKSGCNYRTRRLTNPNSILNAFATFIPIASKALHLRQAARVSDQPASRVFDPIEMRVLRAKAKRLNKKLSRHPTARDALLAIARMGGHRKSSGPPGWATIMKGMDRFLILVEGWRLAEEEK